MFNGIGRGGVAIGGIALLLVLGGAGLIRGAEPAAARADGSGVGEALRRQIEADWIERDRRFTAAAIRPAVPAPPPAPVPEARVTTVLDAAGGCDGVKTGRWGFHTVSGEQDPWWQVELGRSCRLDRVVVYNRTDGSTAPRTRNVQVWVSEQPPPGEFQLVYEHNGETFFGFQEKRPLVVDLREKHVAARIVRLAVPGRCSFALDEVEVYAADDPQKNIALGRPADQKSVEPSAYTKRAKPAAVPPPAPPPPPAEPEFRLAHTREVIERARALAARLRPAADPQRLAPLTEELAKLASQLTAREQAGDCPPAARRTLYFQARWLARRIAFCNPRLDFDRILFVKRPHPTGLFHMVHQFYGFNARPGGSLCVLSEPFAEQPRVTDLLADAVVTQGRLQGQTLTGGAFLAPELSFDGRTILFAYSQCQAEGVEWSPRASFHIFRVQADGSGLVQLTDGPWNDFDPCFLPDGRIALISERRGGYLRCGGSSPPYHSPTYTLHAMAADGSDLVCLSYHETQEWQPSVDHAGQIVFTRWDYVDRDTNVAHHLWTCTPDGRDPRAFHGNYPERRESRPWMEMDIRAIPGSHRYVATAAAHHGVAFGSLVLIDPRLEDDGAMAQVTRLTPEVPLPEAEGGGAAAVRQWSVYGTPWPLSEDDYLCSYGALSDSHGLCWIDRFGNRELLYRDPAVPSLSPVPLRARAVPPVLAGGTNQTESRSARDWNPRLRGTEGANETARDWNPRLRGGEATVAVVNVYDSDFAWPAGATVAALRVIQVLPKSTPRVNTPRIGTANGTNARAVLGTVPVESDGSAYFTAPPDKPLYFQALDAEGRAIQSMRSATYLHAGEQLVCRGCHEHKHRTPAPRAELPLALQRPPSAIQPDVDGSNPFNYVRLVQPVLDRHCVGCHQEKRALDLTGVVAGEHGWTRSYQSLAPQFGFYFHSSKGSLHAGVHGGSRTVAGQFGARAAKLLDYLDTRHYNVQLSAAELHRLVLWLDCNSEFYGSYEDTAAQGRGEIVWPSLE